MKKSLKKILKNPPPKLIKKYEEVGEKNYDTIIDYDKWVFEIQSLQLSEEEIDEIINNVQAHYTEEFFTPPPIRKNPRLLYGSRSKISL